MNNLNLGSIYGFIFAVTKIFDYNDLSWWYICIGFIIGYLFKSDDCECEDE